MAVCTSPGSVFGQGTGNEITPNRSDMQRESAARDALAAAAAISDEDARASALSWLVPHLPDVLLRDALVIAKAISDETGRARALTALAPRLPDTVPYALAAAGAISDGLDRARALAELAPYLPEALLRDALVAATATSDELNRTIALVTLAPYLPETLLRDTLAAAKAISGQYARAHALASLAPHLPEALLRDAFAAATAISEDPSFRDRALAALHDALAATANSPDQVHADASAEFVTFAWGAPPDEKPFAIILSYSGSRDRLKTESDLASAFSELAKKTRLSPKIGDINN